MLERLHALFQARSQKPSTPSWQEILQAPDPIPQPSDRATAMLVAPWPPRAMPPAPEGCTAATTPADILAWSGDTGGARRAYEQQLSRAPLDIIAPMQLMRLARRANPRAPLAPLQQKINQRQPDIGKRVEAWFTLYRPQATAGQPWAGGDLTELLGLSEIAQLKTSALRAVLASPSPHGDTWVEYAAAHQRPQDVAMLLGLDQGASTWPSRALTRALQWAVEADDALTSAALVADCRLTWQDLDPKTLDGLMLLAAAAPDMRFQDALGSRGVSPVRALLYALQHHSLSRTQELLRRVRWVSPFPLAPTTLALRRQHDGLQALELLITHGMPLDGTYGTQEHTPLMEAVLLEMPAAVRLLVAAGAPIDTLHRSTGKTAGDMASPACARELGYPVALEAATQVLAARVTCDDPGAACRAVAGLRDIEPDELEACVALLQQLVHTTPLPFEAMVRAIRWTGRVAASLNEVHHGATVGHWVSQFSTGLARLAAFELVYGAPSPKDWGACVRDALILKESMAAAGPRGDAWLRESGLTLRAIFDRDSERDGPAHAWPLQFTMALTQRSVAMQDRTRAHVYRLCCQFVAHGLAPADYAEQLGGSGDTVIAFLERHAHVGLSRIFAGLGIGVGHGTGASASRQGTPIAAGQALLPRSAETPFVFFEPRRHERRLAREFLRFLGAQGHEDPGAASAVTWEEAAHLLVDPAIIDDVHSERGARAYLQLMQTVLGARTLVALFASQVAERPVDTRVILRLLQRGAHPDKGGSTTRAACLNCLRDLLDTNVPQARALRNAFDATADERQVFYAGQ